MPLAHAVQNARKRAQVVTWTDDSNDATPIDLTGATLYGKKKDKYGTVTAITGTLALTNAAAGVFTWTYSVADLAEPGSFQVQFMAVYQSDGLREKTYLSPWRVHESLDFASTSPSASVSPSVSPSPSLSPSASKSPSASLSPSASKSPSASPSPSA